MRSPVPFFGWVSELLVTRAGRAINTGMAPRLRANCRSLSRAPPNKQAEYAIGERNRSAATLRLPDNRSDAVVEIRATLDLIQIFRPRATTSVRSSRISPSLNSSAAASIASTICGMGSVMLARMVSRSRFSPNSSPAVRLRFAMDSETRAV